VTYSNEAKHRLLGVSLATIERHGAVSAETAREMLAGALACSAADMAVAVTGIAGPGGGTADKPVGTVWIGWQRRGAKAAAQCFHFAGDRDAVRRQTVVAALSGLRHCLTA
jgi:nicotinamide-nucleotide amidase